MDLFRRYLHRQIARFAIATMVTARLAMPAYAADAYPSTTIHVINPWAPGGAADIIIRPIMQEVSNRLGQSVVIDNRPGANGTIGAAIVAKAPPTGYELYFSQVGPVAISPWIMHLSYQPVKDFEPITQIVSGPTVLVVRNDIPVKTVPQLLAYAKAHPGELKYGSIGVGSTTHLAGELLAKMSGTKMVHVPYKGNAPILTDLLGGQISMAFINIAGAAPYIQSGQLRGLAVSTLKRSSLLPDLPTVAETLPGFEVNSWYGLAAPAGTPTIVINKLHDVVAQVLKDPAIVKRLHDNGLEPVGSTPAQFAAQIETDYSRWGKVVKDANIPMN
ncbi:Bug family tripartite tricarboxylate transporter substrate binding protein [Paraburkholderia nemoris]|uniref:Bug family tripartite tricarboxylate transporter substrate binding protein n=1 Tax=Paraburkholderia nemoris TaxID=2793076 RepID=UPI0038B7EEB5